MRRAHEFDAPSLCLRGSCASAIDLPDSGQVSLGSALPARRLRTFMLS